MSSAVIGVSSSAGLQIWDANGTLMRLLPAGNPASFGWHPSRWEIAVGTLDGRILVFRGLSGGSFDVDPIMARQVAESPVTHVSYDPTGRSLVFATEDGVVALFETAAGRITPVLDLETTVQDIAWSPHAESIAVLSGKEICLIALETLEVRSVRLPGPGLALSWPAGAMMIIVGGYNGTVHLFDQALNPLFAFKAHESLVTSLDSSSDGRLLVSSSMHDPVAKVWEITSTSNIEVRELFQMPHDGPVHGVSMSWDGRRVATSTTDKVVLWNVQSGAMERILTGYTRPVSCASWQPLQGQAYPQRLVAALEDELWIWDTSSATRLLRIKEPNDRPFACVEWSPDGTRIASASGSTVVIWSAETGLLERTLIGHEGKVLSVTWSPDSQRIASGSRDGTIMIWDIRGSTPLHVIYAAHPYEVVCVDWSPRGDCIASSSHSIRLWDAGSYRLLAEITCDMMRVQSVQWSPDGSMLAACVVEAVPGGTTVPGSIGLTGRPNATVMVFSLSQEILAKWSFPWMFWLPDELYCPGTVAWSPDGSLLAFATGAHPAEALHTLSYWRKKGVDLSIEQTLPMVRVVTVGSLKSLQDSSAGKELVDPISGFGAPVSWVGFSPDGSRVAAASWDGTIRTIDLSEKWNLLVLVVCVFTTGGVCLVHCPSPGSALRFVGRVKLIRQRRHSPVCDMTQRPS